MSSVPFIHLAYFISPHGYGHAARACAVMEALYALDPRIEFEIFTTVPFWFFKQSLSGEFHYHAYLTDIGLKQKSALEADFSGTLEALDGFMPFDPEQINALAETLQASDCGLVLCDIAAMGIVAAERAGIPSVLIENFTWDWIYEASVRQAPGFQKHIRYLKEWFGRADHHIQTTPVCVPAPAALQTAPVSRMPVKPRNEIRKQLDLGAECKLVLITMGGVPSRHPFLKNLAGRHDCFFVVPGAGEVRETHSNLLILPQNSGFYHPDLIGAADAVIGKAGYSTIAEVFAAGVPFGYVPSGQMRETEALIGFIEKEISAVAISEEEYYPGTWLEEALTRLLALPHMHRTMKNGADQIARYIFDLPRGA